MSSSATTTTNGTAPTNGAAPKIVLYTNHRCPFAHRAHIALEELKLPYEEIFVDLDTPREPWYLAINPRGLVPSLHYTDPTLSPPTATITESAIVAHFLSDTVADSPLLPTAASPAATALVRARIAFFTDTWATKVQPLMYPLMYADAGEQASLADNVVSVMKKEIEPLLQDAAPFFGGSEAFTMAEVLVAPFLIRWVALSGAGLLPGSVKEGILGEGKLGEWARRVVDRESVLGIWDEEVVVKTMRGRVEKRRAEAAEKK